MGKKKIIAEPPEVSTEAAADAGRKAFADRKTIADNPYSVMLHPWSRRAWAEGFGATRRGAETTEAI